MEGGGELSLQNPDCETGQRSWQTEETNVKNHDLTTIRSGLHEIGRSQINTLIVRACSEVREALEKVSSSTKTAFLTSNFWRESRFDVISVRLSTAPFHLSSLPPLLPFSISSILSSLNLSVNAIARGRETGKEAWCLEKQNWVNVSYVVFVRIQVSSFPACVWAMTKTVSIAIRPDPMDPKNDIYLGKIIQWYSKVQTAWI